MDSRSDRAKVVYLGFGSNLGDRAAHVKHAIEALAKAGVKIERLSAFYKTEPVDFKLQPWFLNCVAEAKTELMPLQLLHVCKRIEREGGRRPGVPKGPRTIDIDILFYGNEMIRRPDLVVPHERAAERRFVLIPLCEIAPELRHPGLQQTVAELLRETGDTARVERMAPDAVWVSREASRA